MTEEEKLIEKLHKIEALFSRSGTDGERIAAEYARERIIERLRQVEREDPPVEYRFTIPDQWSRRLFIALLRRYGLDPFRYRGQRRTTLMVMVPRGFVKETLWPEYERLQETLTEYFNNFTERVIAEVLNSDSSEVKERDEPLAIPPSS